MARLRSENRGKNEVETSDTSGKRKVDELQKDSPSKRQKPTGSVPKSTAKKNWKFIVPEKSWLPGKITTVPTKGVLTKFKSNLNKAQQNLLRNTCFGHFLDCHEIVVQSQLIHYFLLRQVRQPNENEMWFNIAGRFVRFSLTEFCLVSGLKCSGSDDTSTLEKHPSRLKDRYFSTLKVVTNEDVRDAFLAAGDIPDHDVSMLGALYFITSYLYSRDYKKVVEHYLFVLVEDFNAMNTFPWGKSLFDTLIRSLREGLSKRSIHYRLRGLLTAFQVWIYETIPSLDGYVATRTSSVFPRIKNWMTEDHPSTAKLEGPECFSNPNIQIRDLNPSDIEIAMPYMTDAEFIKPVQPELSRETKTKEGVVDRTAHCAGTSGKPGPSGVIPPTPMLLLTDARVGHSDVQVDDDDFVDPPHGGHGTSSHTNSPIGDGQPAVASDLRAPHSAGPHSNDVVDELRKQFSGQISELQAKNQMLNGQLNDMKSQMLSFKSDQHEKMNLIVRMQGKIRTELANIKSNMRSMSDSITALNSL